MCCGVAVITFTQSLWHCNHICSGIYKAQFYNTFPHDLSVFFFLTQPDNPEIWSYFGFTRETFINLLVWRGVYDDEWIASLTSLFNIAGSLTDSNISEWQNFIRDNLPTYCNLLDRCLRRMSHSLICSGKNVTLLSRVLKIYSAPPLLRCDETMLRSLFDPSRRR